MSKIPVAIVTGGARGLGAAIAVVLLKKGYKVCIADVNVKTGEEFVEQQQEIYGSDFIIFALCDVSQQLDYEKVFDIAIKEFGRIDLVVNNAGVHLERDPRKCVDVNLMGPIIGSQLALRHMGKSNGGNGGMVINTASILGFLPEGFSPVYSATKHGIIGLTRSYGAPHHFEKDGILFAALCPSYTNTQMLQNTGIEDLIPGFDILKLAGDKLMNPDYVAEGVSKLMEDKINGSTLLVTKNNGYQYIPIPEGIPD